MYTNFVKQKLFSDLSYFPLLFGRNMWKGTFIPRTIFFVKSRNPIRISSNKLSVYINQILKIRGQRTRGCKLFIDDKGKAKI